MYSVEVLTYWITDNDNVAAVVQHYQADGVAWTDATGQVDANLLPDPNVVVWHGRVDEATLTALEADANVV
ncbi:MAG: hypothetical protein KC519_19295, partial [Anaerolineae bacterium]|nr:hypothetical protein [Anaerolineae bacterium]